MRISKKTTVLLTCMSLTGCSPQDVAREPGAHLGAASKFLETPEPIQ